MKAKAATATLLALAHETRLGICLELAKADEGLLSSELSERLGISRTLLSSHVKVLAHAEIVESSKSGRNVRWRLRDRTLRKISDFVAAFVRS